MTRDSKLLTLKPAKGKSSRQRREPWKVLSVEDNEVYQKTQLSILENLTYNDRPLDILTASNTAEASKLLSQHDDIALILLDIVMEDDHAGLRLVNTIREIQGNNTVRIVIITGQPGIAPEESILEKYDIDQYYEKSHITSILLKSVVIANLRAWDYINQLKRAKEGLQLIVDSIQRINSFANLEEFSASVLDEITKLCNLQNHNIGCFQVNNSGDLELLTAHSDTSVNDAPQLKIIKNEKTLFRLKTALNQKAHFFSEDYSILYFHDSNSPHNPYLVYVDSYVELSTYSRNLLRVFSENVKTGFANVALSDRLKQHAYYDQDLNIFNRNRLQRELTILSQSDWEACEIILIRVVNAADIISTLGRDIFNIYLEAIVKRAMSLQPNTLIHARYSRNSIALVTHSSTDPYSSLSQFTASLENPYDEIIDFRFRLAIVHAPLAEFETNNADGVFDYLEIATKKAESNSIALYEFQTSLVQQAENRTHLAQQLYRDVEQGNLEVYFQPKIELSTGRATGCEALARWKYNNSWINPELFIEIAEQGGFIDQLDAVVTKQVLDRAVEAEQRGINLLFSINMSPTELRSHKQIDTLFTLIQERGLNPEQIQIEITEQNPVNNYQFFDEHLSDLKAFGVKVALDDFGKGYSSLMHIVKLSIDTIKIDKEFVSDFLTNPSSATAIELTHNLSEKLGMRLVAEGVETAEQDLALKQLGIGYAQGYYYSKPLPWTEFLTWIDEHN